VTVGSVGVTVGSVGVTAGKGQNDRLYANSREIPGYFNEKQYFFIQLA